MQSAREDSKLATQVAEKVGQTFFNSLVVDGTKRAMEIKNLILPSDAKQIQEINESIKNIIQKQMAHKIHGGSPPVWCEAMTNGSISKALVVLDQDVKLSANAEYISSLKLKSKNQGGALYVQVNTAIQTLCSWIEEAGFFTKSNNTHPCNHFVVWIIEQLLDLKSAATDEERLDRLNIIYEVIMWAHNSAKFAKNEMSLKKNLSSILSCLNKVIQCQTLIIEKKSSDDYLKEVSTLTISEIDSIKSAIFSTFLSQPIPSALTNNKLREEKGGIFRSTNFMKQTILPVIMKKLGQLDEDPQPDEEGVFFTEEMVKEGNALIALGTERHYCHFEMRELSHDLMHDSYIFDPKRREIYYTDKDQKTINITKQFLNNEDIQAILKPPLISKDQIITLQNIILKYHQTLSAQRKSSSNIDFIHKLDQLSVDQNGMLIGTKALESKYIQTGFAADLLTIQANNKIRKQYWKNFVDLIRLIEQMQRINIIYEELQKCIKSIGEINSFVLMLPHINMAILIGREILDKLEGITREILELRVRFTTINQERHKIPSSRGVNIHAAADFANETKMTYIHYMHERIKKLEFDFQKNIKAIASGEKIISEAINNSYLTILPIYHDMTKLGILNARFDPKKMNKAQSLALAVADRHDSLNSESIEEMKSLSQHVDAKTEALPNKNNHHKKNNDHSFVKRSASYFELITGKKAIQFNIDSISHIIDMKNRANFLDSLTLSTPSVFAFWRRNHRQSLLAARLAICHEVIDHFLQGEKDANKKTMILSMIEIQIASVNRFSAPLFLKELLALRMKVLFIPIFEVAKENVSAPKEISNQQQEKTQESLKEIAAPSLEDVSRLITIDQPRTPQILISEVIPDVPALPQLPIKEPSTIINEVSSYGLMMKTIPPQTETPLQAATADTALPEEVTVKKLLNKTPPKPKPWFERVNEILQVESEVTDERYWFDPNI